MNQHKTFESIYDDFQKLKDTIKITKRAIKRNQNRFLINTAFTENRNDDLPVLERHVEDWFQLYTALGICARQQIQMRHDFTSMRDLYIAATGWDVSDEDMLKVGERVMNLERAINAVIGFSRKDDKFPEMWFKSIEAVEDPNIKKTLTDYYHTKELTPEDVEKMYDDFYTGRGWDVATGIPTRDKLVEVGLDDMAAMLEKEGVTK